MTTTPGPKSEPLASSQGAPTFSGDLRDLAAYAALVGNHIVGTSAQRTAFEHPGWDDLDEPWEGLVWQETDAARNAYLYANDGWVLLTSPRAGTAGLDYQPSWGNASSMRISRRHGVVTMQLSVSKVGGINDGNVPGYLVPGFRPAVEIRGAGQYAGSGTPTAAFFSIATDGKITLSGDAGSHTLFFTPLSYEHA